MTRTGMLRNNVTINLKVNLNTVMSLKEQTEPF